MSADADAVEADHRRALCEAAVTLSERSGAHAIVAVTHEGMDRAAARRQASERDRSSPPPGVRKWPGN